MKKKLKKTLSILLILSFLTLIPAYRADSALNAGSPNPIPGFEIVSSRGNLILHLNRDTAEIALENIKTGYVWRSNPEKALEDEIAIKAVQLEMMSQILVEYLDLRGLKQYANSHVASVNKGTFTVDKTSQGIKVAYNFDNLEFTVPVEYALEEDSLKVTILVDEISEEGPNSILSISLLPYFGAGGLSDEGYIFVPDGSGAIINFNNGKYSSETYSGNIYGRDLISPPTMRRSETQQIKMPIFGIKIEDNALFSVVGENSGKGSISANVSGRYTGYNYVYSRFTYRNSASLKLQERDYKSKEILTAEKEPLNEGNYSVSYFVLGGGSANYSGMANLYREHLIKNQGLKKRDSVEKLPLYIEFFGGTKIKKPFLGIPIDVFEPFTTFEQAKDILESYKDSGVENIVVKYSAWDDGGLKSYLPLNAKPESKLGGKKGMKDMISYGKKEDINIFFNVDFINLYQKGQGVSKYKHAIKTINNGAPSNQYEYKLSSFVIDGSIKPWNIITPLEIPKLVSKFIKAFTPYQHDYISVDTLGSVSYSDFRKNGVNKDQAIGIFEEVLGDLQSMYKETMLSRANSYAFPFGDYIYEAPYSSSRFDIIDETVPFYQMVLHGMVSYSLPPINRSTDLEESILTCIETGASPAFVLTGSDTSVLKTTEFSYFYSTYKDYWTDSVIRAYREINKALSPVSDQVIVEHKKIADDIFQTKYEKGKSIIVNYSQKDYEVKGKVVKAKNYLLLEDGI